MHIALTDETQGVFIFRIKFPCLAEIIQGLPIIVQKILGISHSEIPPFIFSAFLLDGFEQFSGFGIFLNIVVRPCKKAGRFKIPFCFRNLFQCIDDFLMLFGLVPFVYLLHQFVIHVLSGIYDLFIFRFYRLVCNQSREEFT